MALTEIQLRNLISFNVPDNIQGLVTPFKIREVMNEMVTKAFDSQLDSLTADNPLSFNPTTKTLSMPRATAGQSGYLHAFDFAVFNTVAGDYVSQQGAYYNPSWLMELSWNKIINTPTSLSGYGITDPVVLTSGNYTDPSWIASLAYSKLTGAPVLGTVAAINTNGNGNTYLAGDGTWKTIDLSGYVTLSGAQTISGAKTFSSLNIGDAANYANVTHSGSDLLIRGFGVTNTFVVNKILRPETTNSLNLGTDSSRWSNVFANRFTPLGTGTAANPQYNARVGGDLNSGLYIGSNFVGLSVLAVDAIRVFSTTNVTVGYASPVDGGFKLDVNGTLRATGLATLPGGVVVGGSSLNASAVAQFDSTTKGVLLSRMTTTQRTDIVSPAAGLIVYDTTLNHLCFYNGTAWQRISHSPA